MCGHLRCIRLEGAFLRIRRPSAAEDQNELRLVFNWLDVVKSKGGGAGGRR